MYVLLMVVCSFVLFLLAIVLSVLLRYTDYDCPFGIFNLFFLNFMSREYKCPYPGFSWIRFDRRFSFLCWFVLYYRRSVSCVLF